MAVKAAKHAQTKAERLNAAKQHRDHKRAALLEQRRAVGPPVVVALLPLSADVDVERLWAGLLGACSEGTTASAAAPDGKPAGSAGGMDVDAAAPAAPGSSGAVPRLAMQTLSLADRRRARFTFLPPPANREDALAVVDLGKVAEVGRACRRGCQGGQVQSGLVQGGRPAAGRAPERGGRQQTGRRGAAPAGAGLPPEPQSRRLLGFFRSTSAVPAASPPRLAVCRAADCAAGAAGRRAGGDG